MVICNGTLPYTIRAINSIQKYTNIPYELIVVDNATYDGTTAWLKSNGISYIRIPYKDPVSYGTALNKGLRVASAPYLGILNNDIFVTPNWLQLMLNCFNDGKKIKGVNKIGIVGPMSNAVGYEQNVGAENLQQLGYSDKEEDILRFAQNWLNIIWNNKDDYFKYRCSRVGMLVGFCWIMSRECYQEVGDFAEFTKGGFEDNDYVHRANLKGFASIMSQASFVHHDCHKSFDALGYNDMRYGLNNRMTFYNKWKSKEKEKNLVIGFIGDLEGSCGYLNDNNEKVYGCISEKEKSILLKKLYQSGADWIILLDNKEKLEPRLTSELLKKLMNPINPQTYAYQFRIITAWDDPKRQRIDELFQNRIQVKMFRNLPGYGIEDGIEPEFPDHNIKVCPYRVYDYSYLIKMDRIKEYEKLSDNEKKKFDCILDDLVQTIPIQDDLTLGLATIMKDEMKFPDYNIEDFMDLYHTLFDEMVIVDTGSTDNSIEIAEYYGAKVIKKQWNDDFSEMRNIAFDNCNTSWILSLDFDERLGNDILRFRRWIEMPNIAYRIPILHPDLKTRELVETWKCRLFKNIKEIRYVDAVHEEVETSIKALNNGRKVISLPNPGGNIPFIGIYHFGNNKDPKWVREKKDYYEKLCRKIIEKNPEHGYANYSLALHHAYRNEDEKASEHFDRAIIGRPDFGLFYIMACKHKIKEGKDYLKRALNRINPETEEYAEIRAWLKKIDKLALKVL